LQSPGKSKESEMYIIKKDYFIILYLLEKGREEESNKYYIMVKK